MGQELSWRCLAAQESAHASRVARWPRAQVWKADMHGPIHPKAMPAGGAG